MKKEWVVFILIIILLIVAMEYRIRLIQANHDRLIDSMTSEQNSIESELWQEQENNQLLIEELDTLTMNLISLNNSYEGLKSSYSELGTDFRDLKDEAYGTIDKIEDFERELEDSLDWFNVNSELKDITNENRIKNSLTGRCWDRIDDRCYVKLGCFFFVNHKLLGLRYKYDTVTSGEVDELQSLGEFITNYGGDCEDYSLFYKAEYNYVLDRCSDADGLDLEAWQPALGKEYWLDTQELWYLELAEAIFLPEDEIYPSVVCGNIHDPSVRRIAGHCVVVFSKQKINSVEHVKNLQGSLVEPQNGRYLGVIGQYAKIATTKIVDNTIWMIITDEDLFLFSDDNGWQGYSTLLADLDSYKTELIDAVKYSNN